MNTITLTGNLTKDPILERTTSGKAIAKGTIAVNRNFGKETDFFDFDVWEQQAEYLSKYGHKGDKVEIVGSMENTKYKNKNGDNVSKWAVRVMFITVYNPMKNNDSKVAVAESKEEIDFDDIADDIPF